MSDYGFLDELDLRQKGWDHDEDRAIWETRGRLRYHSKLMEIVIDVPSEFRTDLASVPRKPAMWLIAGGRGNRSSIPHDWAYQFGYWILEDGTKLIMTRRQADEVFYESLCCDPYSGVNKFKAWLMYEALRVGGWAVWNKRRERTPDLNPIWAKEKGVVATEDQPTEAVEAGTPSAPPIVDAKEPPKEPQA